MAGTGNDIGSLQQNGIPGLVHFLPAIRLAIIGNYHAGVVGSRVGWVSGEFSKVESA